MEQNKEEMTWDDVEKKIAERIKKSRQENFTTEIFREFKAHSRVAITGMAALLAVAAFLYYKNDYDWRKLLNSYDIVSKAKTGEVI